MEIDTTSIDERVARGIALLDAQEPGWREKVNVNRLDMRTCHNCIFGQVYGDISIGLRKTGLIDDVSKLIADDESDPGFQHGILTRAIPGRLIEDHDGQDRIDADFSLLTDAWKRALEQED